MEILILSQNFERYTGGYYHQDWINSFKSLFSCDVYGPGYERYNIEDTIYDVFSKYGNKKYDLIVASSSWDKPGQKQQDGDVNIHPNIDLSLVNIPKIYFLNKEYINIDAKLAYAKKQRFSLILTVLNQEKYQPWYDDLGIPFLQVPFAVDLNRIVLTKKKYDFSFSGALHSNYTDLRFLVKKEIFKSNQSLLQKCLLYLVKKIAPSKNWDFLNSLNKLPSNLGFPRFLNYNMNPVKKQFKEINVYWAERHPISYGFNLKNLLPFGNSYFRLISSSKSFLCTLSAEGIIGPRFYELMASKTLIICPKGEYDGLLQDGYNCIMYENPVEIIDLINKVVTDNVFAERITENAYKNIDDHTYDFRVKFIISYLLNKIL